ncbi:MAG: hypothetical protein KAR23_06395 [Candidatus Aenigmarchaeota archaeon]|nr:hypothetical protein [Candidatus Aenigmarchaeota archaeon]
MPPKDNMIVLDVEDRDITAKAKELNKKGWRFSDKKDGKIYYERYKDPLLAVDSSHLIIFFFVATVISLLVIGLAVY